jgi:hypothetical protein
VEEEERKNGGRQGRLGPLGRKKKKKIFGQVKRRRIKKVQGNARG